MIKTAYTGGLVQDCSNFSASAMELLQSCTKPSICNMMTMEQQKEIFHPKYAKF